MEEDIYLGKYVSIDYIDRDQINSYRGKLEKIILEEGDVYKVLFKEMYILNDEGKYELIRKKTAHTETDSC